MAANKITYDQAVATIQAMFGSEIERDTIITLLQANRGHVEKTIDDILAMSAAGSPTVAVPSQSAASAQHPASTTVVEVEDTFVGVHFTILINCAWFDLLNIFLAIITEICSWK